MKKIIFLIMVAMLMLGTSAVAMADDASGDVCEGELLAAPWVASSSVETWSPLPDLEPANGVCEADPDFVAQIIAERQTITR